MLTHYVTITTLASIICIDRYINIRRSCLHAITYFLFSRSAAFFVVSSRFFQGCEDNFFNHSSRCSGLYRLLRNHPGISCKTSRPSI